MNRGSKDYLLARFTVSMIVFAPGFAGASDEGPLGMQVTSIHSTLASSCSPDHWSNQCAILAGLDQTARFLLSDVQSGRLSEVDAKQKLQEAREKAKQSDAEEKQRERDERAAVAAARDTQAQQQPADDEQWLAGRRAVGVALLQAGENIRRDSEAAQARATAAAPAARRTGPTTLNCTSTPIGPSTVTNCNAQ